MKLNMSKFKKVSSDKDHTIMEHEDGHLMKIAHAALSSKMRAEIKKMPEHKAEPQKMAEGGIAQHACSNPNCKSVGQVHPNCRCHGAGMAKGGEVMNHCDAKRPHDSSCQYYAEGGMAERAGETVRNAAGDAIDAFKNLGSDIADVGSSAAKPVLDFGKGLLGNSEPLAPSAESAPEVPQQDPLLAKAQSDLNTASQPAATASPLAQAPVAAPQPSLQGGFEQQQAGIRNEANALGQQGVEQEQALKSQLGAVDKLMSEYQQHYKKLDDERNAFQKDIMDKHIDPNHYLGSMDTGGKFDTAVGLILGGLGGGGTSNLALDFLNKQIDRDVAAQQMELGKKESLLSANMKQFGNLKDATDMTKVMMNDLLVSKLKMAEAKAMNPIAKARAQKEIGALQAQMAPLMYEFATRKTLQEGGPAADALTSGKDPASFVPLVVPQQERDKVFEEIKNAQNARSVAKLVLQNFDAVSNKMQSAGGLGRLKVAAYSPAELEALKAELGTTVGEKEGTIRETAQHNVENSYLPKISDTAEKMSKRREELVNYLKLKSAAPVAKGYNLDLDKFDSTTRKTAAPVQEVERIGPDGRVGIFDANTRKLLRYK